MRTIVVIVLLFLSTICWAAEKAPASALCMGIDQQLPDKNLYDTIIHALYQQMPKKEKIAEPIVITKIDKHMAKDNWHVVWASPVNMERGIFLLRGDAKNIEYVAVWGGVAFPEEESSVLQWFKDQAPTAPISLLKCVAHEITHVLKSRENKSVPKRSGGRALNY